MRFSSHQTCPPSNPAQERSRRRARFVNEVKAVILEAANQTGLNLVALSQIVGKDKGSVSRALRSDTNIEIFTMFEFSEALGKEWKVCLVGREQDLGQVMAGVSSAANHSRTSWSPITTNAERVIAAQHLPEAPNQFRMTHVSSE